jgi:vacuolar-type H+-ATPase subunit H
MAAKIGKMEEVLLRKFKKVKNGLDEAEVLAVIKELVEQNRSLTERLAHLDSLTRLAERTVIEAGKIKTEAETQAQQWASEIIEGAEAKARSEAEEILKAAEARAQNQADEIIRAAETQAQQQAAEIIKAAEAKARSAEEIKRAAEEIQVILQSAIDKAEIVKAQAEVEAKKIIDGAKKEAGYSRKEAVKLVEYETQNILKEPNSEAAQASLPRKQKDEKQEYDSAPRRREKGTVTYCWNVEIERQQHRIEVLLNTALGLFATGGGRLLVDGETVNDWGWNPFTLIPRGRLEVKIANRRAFISPKGATTKYPVLILGNQEIPPSLVKT